MTGGESLQCQIVPVAVSQCPTGGWPNHHGTVNFGNRYIKKKE
jgi:hypothetical protein